MNDLKVISGADLIDLINKGQSNAFANFYTLYFQKLLLASDGYVKNVFAAEEIVQDIFLKLWESPETLEHVKSIKSYLYKAVINASLNYVNRQKSIETHHEKIASELSEEYLLDLDGENELIVFLKGEIDKLPTKCQHIFKLNRFEGLKYREIASHLGISEKTVENHVANALKTLREAMISKKIDRKHPKFYLVLLQLYFF